MGITILKYPDNIEEESFSTRRIVFMAIPGELTDETKNWYKGEKGSDIQSKNDDKMPPVKCMITLPLPGTLQDQQGHTWNQESILDLGMKLGSNLLEPISSAIGEVLHIDSDKIPSLDSAAENVSSINTLATQLLGARKRVMNPGAFQTYTSSSLRSFSFSFDFVPETKNEAKSIIDIVAAFKTYSSPSESWGGITLLAPFIWQIVITNGTINKLLQLSECACTSVTVTYGTDKFDIFEDGMPKKITLSLSFNETRLKYADNYNKGLETQTNDSLSVLSASTGFTNSMITNTNVLDTEGGDVLSKESYSKVKGVLSDMKDSLLSYF